MADRYLRALRRRAGQVNGYVVATLYPPSLPIVPFGFTETRTCVAADVLIVNVCDAPAATFCVASGDNASVPVPTLTVSGVSDAVTTMVATPEAFGVKRKKSMSSALQIRAWMLDLVARGP